MHVERAHCTYAQCQAVARACTPGTCINIAYSWPVPGINKAPTQEPAAACTPSCAGVGSATGVGVELGVISQHGSGTKGAARACAGQRQR